MDYGLICFLDAINIMCSLWHLGPILKCNIEICYNTFSLNFIWELEGYDLVRNSRLTV